MAGPEVKVKVGADTGELEKGLALAQAKLSSFAKIGLIGAATAAATLAAGMIGLTKQSMDNIDVLAKQARSLGLTTAAFQKMSMVAGEAGVEAGKLSALLGIMQRNINELQQGTALQIKSFAALGLSIADLQGLSPDEQFAKIAASLDLVDDATTKTALAMEVFGRGGREAINMINGYGEAALNAAEFQNRFGIAVGQTASDNVEKANDAVGRLGMVMSGLGNTMAGIVAPAVEGLANGLIAFAGSVIGAKVTLEEFFGTLQAARDNLGEDIFNKLVGRPDLIKEVAPQLDDIVMSLESVAAVIEVSSAGMTRLEEHLNKIGQFGAADVMRQYGDELRDAGDQYAKGAITGEQFRAKVVSINDRARDLLGTFHDVNGASFSMLMGELSALTRWLNTAKGAADDLAAALPVGMDTGTFLSGDVSGLMPPTPGVSPVMTSTAPPRAPALLNETGVVAGTGTGNASGGGTSPAQQRLDTLIESLKTEAEVVQEWYDQSLEALNAANDAQLEAIGGKQAAIERLEQEHQERLAGIREMGNQWGVEAALSGGAEILGALASTNKKAAKLQGIFAAGAALVSTYQGAAKELEKGTFGFASAAAVIAKGIGFVTAIRSASSSAASGSVASTGGGASAAAAPQVTETRTANINFYGGFQPTQETIKMIAGGLNNWLGDGGKLNVGAT